MNKPLNDLISLVTGLRTHATNLNKDLDENDRREETKLDLSQLFKGFNELRTVMSKLEQNDKAKLQDELKQLMSGEENFLEYNRDVINILMEVQRRTERSAPVKDKVIQNLPTAEKSQNVGSIFDNWRSILTNVQKKVEASTSQKTGSR